MDVRLEIAIYIALVIACLAGLITLLARLSLIGLIKNQYRYHCKKVKEYTVQQNNKFGLIGFKTDLENMIFSDHVIFENNGKYTAHFKLHYRIEITVSETGEKVARPPGTQFPNYFMISSCYLFRKNKMIASLILNENNNHILWIKNAKIEPI